MRGLWTRFRSVFQLSYGQKIFLLTTVPLILAVAAISLVVANQSRQLSETEIRELETQLLEAKKEELKNYIALARTAIGAIYGNAAPDDEEAKLEVSQILSGMIYGQDGFFFVYDYDGTNLVSPRQTFLIGKNWIGLSDINGVPVVDEIIRIARSGGGYHNFDWPKPSTRETARIVVYTTALPDWKWAIGTGVYIDDVLKTVASAREKTEARIRETFLMIVMITIGALLSVTVFGLLLNLRERRLADGKLQALTERILDTQEEERGRVARELHDSISQILVGIRYTLELARRRVASGDERAKDNLDKGIDGLQGAIAEVRRISADLRPGVLDDLGLGPALKALVEEFSQRTGIKADFETVVFRNRLDKDAKIALYRVAQEALTNIERHAEASRVAIEVSGHRQGATMRIQDDGKGIAPQARNRGGLGLRNMQERMDQLRGSLRVLSSEDGTVIEASVPLSHMLPPEARGKPTNPRKTA